MCGWFGVEGTPFLDGVKRKSKGKQSLLGPPNRILHGRGKGTFIGGAAHLKKALYEVARFFGYSLKGPRGMVLHTLRTLIGNKTSQNLSVENCSGHALTFKPPCVSNENPKPLVAMGNSWPTRAVHLRKLLPTHTMPKKSRWVSTGGSAKKKKSPEGGLD